MVNKFFIFVIVMTLYSCALFEDGGDDPAILDIPEITLTTNIPSQGDNSHDIADVWVFVDGQGLGVFELPTTVPVITTSAMPDFVIFGGIRKNGMRDNAIVYPFYQSIEFVQELTPLTIQPLQLDFAYRDNVTFALLENFELGNQFTKDEDEDMATSLSITDDMFRNGAKSGNLKLTAENPSIEVSNQIPFSVPTDGTPTYLEIDYKGDTELVIGLVGVESSGLEFKNFIIVLVSQTEWTKIYVDLTEELALSEFENYRLVMGATVTDSGSEEANVFIDNLKIVHL